MDELLRQAMHGVDPNAPGAYWHVVANLMQLMPWGLLFWTSVICIAVGALLGWWKHRLAEGIVLAVIFGPIGWLLLFRPRRKPAARAPHRPPPLPPSH